MFFKRIVAIVALSALTVTGALTGVDTERAPLPPSRGVCAAAAHVLPSLDRSDQQKLTESTFGISCHLGHQVPNHLHTPESPRGT